MKKSEVTKARIDEVARAMFREKGFPAVTMRDIAAGSELPVSVLYYYYKSKDALYTETTYQQVLAMFQRLRARANLSRESPLDEVFTDLIEVRAPENLTEDELALYRTSILEWLGARGDTPLTLRLRRLIEAGKQVWIAEAKARVDLAVPVPDYVISLVYEYMEHEIMSMLFGIRPFSRERVRRDIAHILKGECR